MTAVTIFLLASQIDAIKFYVDVRKAARSDYLDPIKLEIKGIFKDAEAVCDEIFDLTNNPGRYYDRIEVFGDGRSLSVGDIVGTTSDDGGMEFRVCAPNGWVILD